MIDLKPKADFNPAPTNLAEETAAAVPKNLQEAFTRVVKAGMKVMFSEQTHDMMMEQLSQDGEMPQVLGEGIAGLMLLLYQKSNQTMPAEVVVPAGIYLLAKGEEFLETLMQEEIPPEVTAQAIEVMLRILMEKFGIPPDRFNAAMKKAMEGAYQ